MRRTPCTLYPKVFVDWKDYETVYGEVGDLPTHLFLKPMEEGQEVNAREKRTSSTARLLQPVSAAHLPQPVPQL